MAPETATTRPTDLPVKGGLSVGKRRLALEDLRHLPPLLTPSEAFDVVGVSTSTGYEWIKRGVIPVVRLGSRMYVRTASLLEEVLGISSTVLFTADPSAPGIGSTTTSTPDKKGLSS